MVDHNHPILTKIYKQTRKKSTQAIFVQQVCFDGGLPVSKNRENANVQNVKNIHKSFVKCVV